MDAALYFELVDAVARIDGQAELEVVSERVMATPEHPLERRILDRALRARTEALALQRELLSPGLFNSATSEAKPLAARG
jgi:hypothetical protein